MLRLPIVMTWSEIVVGESRGYGTTTGGNFLLSSTRPKRVERSHSLSVSQIYDDDDDQHHHHLRVVSREWRESSRIRIDRISRLRPPLLRDYAFPVISLDTHWVDRESEKRKLVGMCGGDPSPRAAGGGRGAHPFTNCLPLFSLIAFSRLLPPPPRSPLALSPTRPPVLLPAWPLKSVQDSHPHDHNQLSWLTADPHTSTTTTTTNNNSHIGLTQSHTKHHSPTVPHN